LNTAHDIKLKGIDPNRRPSLRKGKYIDLCFELTRKAPRDWCLEFNMLLSKHEYKARINPDQGLYVETWVRDMTEIPKEFEHIKKNILLCTERITEKERLLRAQSNVPESKASSDDARLQDILATLEFD
jgi:hypothetical protein